MLFGTSGIRDFYGSAITPELAMRIANAFASKGNKVAVASDLRQTSELLKSAAISGVLSAGADAIDLGAVPTPTLALYTQEKECAGMMITASHNPSEYNGLKLYRGGREVSRAEEGEVERKYGNGMRLCGWKEAGRVFAYPDAAKDHIGMAVRNVDSAAVRKAKIKVVVDTNGVATEVAPLLLRELGCETFEINRVERGFARPSEPNDANLSKLKTEVRTRNAHLGIGHDGDADRAIIVDENGELLGLDVQFAIAIAHELGKPGTRSGKPAVVSTVEASLLIKETVEKNGGRNIVVGVGSTNVSEAMEKEEGAVFGGEPAGEFIYRGGVNTPDGMMVAAKFLEILAKEGKLSGLKRKYSAYPILREKFRCADRKKAMEILGRKLPAQEFLKAAKLNAIDGMRFDFPDGFLLVRPSGTESMIRLTAEFKTEKRLREIAGAAQKMIRESV